MTPGNTPPTSIVPLVTQRRYFRHMTKTVKSMPLGRNRSVGTSSSIHSEPRSGYSMLTDSWTMRPTLAALAAATTAAEPWIRMRSLSRQARRSINLLIGGIAVARLMTVSWPLIACTSANESNSDARTGVAPWAMSAADFSGERASALTVCPSATRTGIAWPPIAPVAPRTKTLMSSILPANGRIFGVEPREFEPCPSVVQRRRHTLLGFSGACKIVAKTHILYVMPLQSFQDTSALLCCS